MKLQFIVITAVPKDGEDGNLYDDFLVPVEDEDKNMILTELQDYSTAPIKGAMIRVRLRNFTLGEILVCDESGREVAGRGRKPSKWYVERESFDTIEAAVERAQAVQKAAA